MAEIISYIERTKVAWNRPDRSPTLNDDQIKVGCLQRIANATEAMAEYHVRIIRGRDDYKLWYNDALRREERLKRRIAALKGQITKLMRQSVLSAEEAQNG